MGASDNISKPLLANGGVLYEEDLQNWFEYNQTPNMSKVANENLVKAPTLYRGIYRHYDQEVTDSEVDSHVRGTGPISLAKSINPSEEKHQWLSSWTEDPRIAHKFAEQGDKGTVYSVSGLRGFPLHRYVDAAEHPVASDEKEWLVPDSEVMNLKFKHLIKPNKKTQIFVGRSEG